MIHQIVHSFLQISRCREVYSVPSADVFDVIVRAGKTNHGWMEFVQVNFQLSASHLVR